MGKQQNVELPVMTQLSISTLNELSQTDAINWFTACCASTRWSQNMVNVRPYTELNTLLRSAKEQWSLTTESDWLEAFEAHPMIGNVDSLREKFSNTKQLASNEQSGTASATEEELKALHQLNHDYKDKFGFIFIICATGLSAANMLEALQARMNNTRERELIIASEEQLKITLLRINKALNNSEQST
jgi:2-oxo-4-hydroxy-4-carboxy-5-ureidoimidazoline decarboxylase